MQRSGGVSAAFRVLEVFSGMRVFSQERTGLGEGFHSLKVRALFF